MKRLTVPAGMPDSAHSAWRVALRRAAHQLHDAPLVLRDPYAVPLLGTAGEDALRRTPAAGKRVWSRSLRAFVVARSAYAEDALAAAYCAGTRQYCLLGAGLDTFAWRNPWPDLRVWELDRPEVQSWKHELARRAGLSETRCESVAGDLLAMPWPPGTMDIHQPAFFALLGVAPFLPARALRELLGRIAMFPRGSAVVFDYRLPREALSVDERRQFDSLQKRATAKGEPLSEGWTPEEMTTALHCFEQVRDEGRAELNARYFNDREDGLTLLGEAARVVLAMV